MDLSYLKSLYLQDVNIIDHLEKEGLSRSEALAISYDLQAGSYIDYAAANKEYTQDYASEIAEVINQLQAGAESIMEVGVGEATTLANVRARLDFEPDSIGFDISLSRVLFAREYFNANGRGVSRFFVGDMFGIPYADDSIDIVYTSHTIEPNGGRESEALKELYRVTRKYLVLFEPSYELAGAEARERITRLGYIKNLVGSARDLGMNVIEYRLTNICDNPLNPTALLLIEKNENAKGCRSANYCCPQTGKELQLSRGCYWSASALQVYPVILDIPCLVSSQGIVASQFSKFI